MPQVSLDTSFLISLTDPERVHHTVAVEYFRHCTTANIPMYVSVLAAGEYEVGQSVQDLPLKHLRILEFNLVHAVRGAAFRRWLRDSPVSPHPDDRRPVVVNDLNILAQAEEEAVNVLLTEDENTLARHAARLREGGQCRVRVLLLKEGFTPDRLNDSTQGELSL